MTAPRHDTWMPFYVGDYLRDTGRLTTEGHGAYLLLIMDYWTSSSPLPDDDEQLAAVTKLPLERWRKLRPMLARFFQVGDGVWRHKRVEAEIADATERVAKKSKAGKEGATARWGGKGNADANGITNSDASANANGTGVAAASQPHAGANGKPHGKPMHSHSHSHKEGESPSTTEQTAARRIAGKFLELRDELWPGSKPLALLTVDTQAAEFLASGIGADECWTIIERGMRHRQASGLSVIGSLRFFANPVQDAAAEARARAGISRETPPTIEDIDRERRARLKREADRETRQIELAAQGISTPEQTPAMIRKGIAEGKIGKDAAERISYGDVWDELKGVPDIPPALRRKAGGA